MARGKKKEELALEEKLERALVPVEEQPYEVPGNWCWVSLENVSSIISKGTTPKGGKNVYKVSGVNFLRVENFNDNGTICLDNVMHIDEETHKTLLKRSILQDRDILISIAGSLGKTVIVKKEDLPMNTNQAVAFVRLLDVKKILPEYIRYYISSPQANQQLLSKTKVTSIPNLTLEIIADTIFPLPPLPEQQRIVERIESLFAKLDEAKEKVQYVKDYCDSNFMAAVHEALIGNLTEGWRLQNGILRSDWRKEKLGNLGSLERGRSKHRPRNDARLFGGSYPFIQTGDVAEADVYIEKHKQTLSEFGLAQSRMFPKGTLCITIAANIGDVAILSYDCCFPDSVVGFTPYEDVESKYIYYMMSELQKEIQANAPATAQRNINLKILNDIDITIPSVIEQREIIAILDDLNEKNRQVQEKMEQIADAIDIMKKSILAKAFRGELGTNNSAEQPAIEALKTMIMKNCRKGLGCKKLVERH